MVNWNLFISKSIVGTYSLSGIFNNLTDIAKYMLLIIALILFIVIIWIVGR